MSVQRLQYMMPNTIIIIANSGSIVVAIMTIQLMVVIERSSSGNAAHTSLLVYDCKTAKAQRYKMTVENAAQR